MLPNTGSEVVNSKIFYRRYADLNKDFVHFLKTLIATELSPEKLLKKKITGEDVTAQTLYDAMKCFQKILNSPDSGRCITHLQLIWTSEDYENFLFK